MLVREKANSDEQSLWLSSLQTDSVTDDVSTGLEISFNGLKYLWRPSVLVPLGIDRLLSMDFDIDKCNWIASIIFQIVYLKHYLTCK